MKFSHVKESITITFLAIILSLFFLWPALSRITTSFIGDGGDNYEYASYQGLFAKSIVHGEFPLTHTTYWRYPVGFDFSRGFDSYITVVTGGILNIFFGTTVAYNLTIIFLMVLNGILSYIFFKYASKSKLMGIIGMIVYGYSFYTLAKLESHPNLLLIGTLPFFAWSIYRLFPKEIITKKDFAILFGSTLFIGLGSLLYLVIAAIGCAVAAILTLLFFPVRLMTFVKNVFRNIKNAVLPGIIIFIATGILFSSHIVAIASGTFVLLDRHALLSILSPSFTDYIVPNSYLPLFSAHIFHNSSVPSIEKAVFFGWFELLFFILFFGTKLSKGIKAVIGLFVAFFIVLSFGYGDQNLVFLPYQFLSHIFPFSSIVETGRFVVLYSLFSTLAIVLFLTSIRNKTIRTTLIFLLLAGCIFERIPSSIYRASSLEQEKYISIVKNTTTDAVVDIPVNIFYPQYNLLSLYYQKPITDGYFHWSADGTHEKSFIQSSHLTRYTCSKIDPILQTLNQASEYAQNISMLNALRTAHIHTIVVHKDDKYLFPDCRNVRLKLGMLIPSVAQLEPTADEKKVEISGPEGLSSITLYFPVAGTVYLNGLYLSPSRETRVVLTMNGNPVDFDYSWEKALHNDISLTPKYTISLPVESGAQITIYSKEYLTSLHGAVWYKYTTDWKSPYKPYHPPVEKIFDDDKAAVYTIH